MILDWSNTFQTHNRLYIPANATALLFDLRRQDGPSGTPDTLVVELGDQTIASYTLSEGNEDAGFVSYEMPIPAAFLGEVTTVTFRFTTPIELFNGSTAWIDNVGLLAPVPIDDRAVYLPLIFVMGG